MPTSLISTTDGIGRLLDDRVELVALEVSDLGELLRIQGSLDSALTASPVSIRSLHEVTLLSPIGRPGKIWGVGLNYHAKARQTGRSVPEMPILFLKAPSAVVGPAARVALPRIAASQVDFEGELAVVIGRSARDIDPDVAWEHVAGVTAANDMAARDVQEQTKNPTLAKSFDGFGALGGSLLPTNHLGNRDNIVVETRVNGIVCQAGQTSDLIFSIPRLVALLSSYGTLEPGDVILTGSPASTPDSDGQFLKEGDEVSVLVDRALPLTITVAAVDGGPIRQPIRARGVTE